MNKKYTQYDIDLMVDDRGDIDAFNIFSETMPGYTDKLDRIDNRIAKLLHEIREVFPDAEYYTAGGGFNLLLGQSHDDEARYSQQQRVCWCGKAAIGDGDW